MSIQTKRGFVLCVSGPSGSGKTSLCDKLADQYDFIDRSISVTTRPQRPGEQSGDDYIFVSQEEFIRMREAKELLEWAEVFGNLYGTPRGPVDRALDAGHIIVMDIDTVGAHYVNERMKGRCVTVFILPPSLEELERRLQQRRQNTPEDLQRRLAEAQREIAEAPEYQYQVTNAEFDRTYRQLEEIVLKEREPDQSS